MLRKEKSGSGNTSFITDALNDGNLTQHMTCQNVHRR